MSKAAPNLSDLLTQGEACGVEADLALMDGEPALRLALDPQRRNGTLGKDFGDEPTFLLLPDPFTDGDIAVDLRARLLPDAPDFARGFIGLAYRVQPEAARFESVYLRPLNGLAHTPPPPRDRRAMQYFAYPDWKFDRLRDVAPDRFETAAPIRLDHWHRLHLKIRGTCLSVWVDGALVMTLDQTLLPAMSGRVGLWVDIGTEGWFRALSINRN